MNIVIHAYIDCCSLDEIYFVCVVFNIIGSRSHATLLPQELGGHV